MTKMPPRPDRIRRLELRDTPGLTLDGEPASLKNISGARPIIVNATDYVEFSWEAVESVIENANGAFYS